MPYAKTIFMKKIFRSFAGVLLLSTLVCSSAQSGSIQDSATALDETYLRADLKKLAPRMAALLKVDRAVVEQAIVEKRKKFSTLALATLLAEKTGADAAKLISTARDDNWTAELKKAGLADEKIVEYLDSLQSELAFVLLDFRTAKR